MLISRINCGLLFSEKADGIIMQCISQLNVIAATFKIVFDALTEFPNAISCTPLGKQRRVLVGYKEKIVKVQRGQMENSALHCYPSLSLAIL